MSVYAWENIESVTYRSKTINGHEVIYPISSKKGTLKTVDFETAMSKSFEFRKGNGAFYVIEDVNGNEIICDSLFSIRYDKRLMINMDFMGQQSPTTRPDSINGQGWERDANKYFKKLLENNPEWFDDKNTKLINKGNSPVINKRFLEYFPQYEEFEGQILIHHHAGEDGQVFAVPQGVHVGEGGVHNAEKWFGIVANADNNSRKVQEAYEAGYIQADNDVWSELENGTEIRTIAKNKFEYIQELRTESELLSNFPSW